MTLDIFRVNLLVCLTAAAGSSLTERSETLDPTESCVHPGQWSNNPEYIAATTKKRPYSYTEACVHRPTGLVLDHGEHRLHKPRYDTYKNNRQHS